MPMVKDGVASESSVKLLTEHMSECEACKRLFETQDHTHEKASVPQVKKFKWALFAFVALLMAIGGLIGSLSSSANTPMPIALLIIGVLALILIAIFLGRGKLNNMNKFFYGKAIGTVILFVLLGVYLLLKYALGLF